MHATGEAHKEIPQQPRERETAENPREGIEKVFNWRDLDKTPPLWMPGAREKRGGI